MQFLEHGQHEGRLVYTEKQTQCSVFPLDIQTPEGQGQGSVNLQC